MRDFALGCLAGNPPGDVTEQKTCVKGSVGNALGAAARRPPGYVTERKTCVNLIRT